MGIIMERRGQDRKIAVKIHRMLFSIGIKRRKSPRGWFLAWVNEVVVSISKNNKE